MIPHDIAQEMLQLCREIPKHPSKMLKRLAPKEAPRYRTTSKNGNQLVFLQQAVKSQLVREVRDPREDRLRQLVKKYTLKETMLFVDGIFTTHFSEVSSKKMMLRIFDMQWANDTCHSKFCTVYVQMPRNGNKNVYF